MWLRQLRRSSTSLIRSVNCSSIESRCCIGTYLSHEICEQMSLLMLLSELRVPPCCVWPMHPQMPGEGERTGVGEADGEDALRRLRDRGSFACSHDSCSVDRTTHPSV